MKPKNFPRRKEARRLGAVARQHRYVHSLRAMLKGLRKGSDDAIKLSHQLDVSLRTLEAMGKAKLPTIGTGLEKIDA